MAFSGDLENSAGDFDFLVGTSDPATGISHYINNLALNWDFDAHPSGPIARRMEEISITNDAKVMASVWGIIPPPVGEPVVIQPRLNY